MLLLRKSWNKRATEWKAGREVEYTHFTSKQKARVGKYAAESGRVSALGHFKKEFPSLEESTVRLFKK